MITKKFLDHPQHFSTRTILISLQKILNWAYCGLFILYSDLFKFSLKNIESFWKTFRNLSLIFISEPSPTTEKTVETTKLARLKSWLLMQETQHRQ